MDSSSQAANIGSVVEAVVTTGENDAPLYQLESLCMRCEKNGITRILYTTIPNFKEVLLSAFECPHCNERNNEVQFGGRLEPFGCCYTLQVPAGDKKMLNRTVVKSDCATAKIPELDFEIPPQAQRGSLSTVEGMLIRAAEELEALQEERRKVDVQTAEAIDQFLIKLKACATGDSCFTLILDDPTGNSFIENPHAPSSDPALTVKQYKRTCEQELSLGYLVKEALVENSNSSPDNVEEGRHGVGSLASRQTIVQSNGTEMTETLLRYSPPKEEEVMTFPATCGACAVRCETRMFEIEIPYFQKVIVMASSCDTCGYRNSELKPSGPIADKGKKISLLVRNIDDLSRDVIKSDTASVKIPAIDLELACGTLGGVVTTVEGLITKIRENLERVQGYTFGDSLEQARRAKWQDFWVRLEKLLNVEEPWTLIIDDPLANSFVASACPENDQQLGYEVYERSWEQNEELGLNDMDTASADAAYN